jgi:hypothetical protein
MPPQRGDPRQSRGAGGRVRRVGEAAGQSGHGDVEDLCKAEPVLVPDLGHERLKRYRRTHVPGEDGEQFVRGHKEAHGHRSRPRSSPGCGATPGSRDGVHLLGPAQVQQAGEDTEPVSAVCAAAVNR